MWNNKKFARRSKKNKYGVSPAECRTYNGIEFDSAAEMKRYCQLLLLQKAGQIKNLMLQPRFELQPAFKSSFQKNKIKSINYVADFLYEQDCKIVVEDVKGFRTKEYSLKMKIFLYKYPQYIFREIK
jgi:hypothetical protein